MAAILVMASLAWAGSYTPDKAAAAAYAKAAAAGADKAASPITAGDVVAVAAGKATFTTMCVACHGVTGKGDGPAAPALTPRPADLTDAARWAFTPVGTKQWILLNGVAHTPMAPEGLTATQAWQVLAYIHTLQPQG